MDVRFAHTNLIARDWRRLVAFYCEAFGCEPVGPERDLAGDWLSAATGVPEARLRGVHLRLPGCGAAGPTLEVFQYGGTPREAERRADSLGFAHIAFRTDDVETLARRALAAGATPAGRLTRREIEGAGELVFQYLHDPEGNLVEVQSWSR